VSERAGKVKIPWSCLKILGRGIKEGKKGCGGMLAKVYRFLGTGRENRGGKGFIGTTLKTT